MMVDRYPNFKEEVGGLNPGYEIFFLPGGKLVKWSTTSRALALIRQPSVYKLKNK
jgi:hypothetical protein